LSIRGLRGHPSIALWYAEPNAVSNAIDYAKFRSRSHNAVIRVFDEADKMIETHEHVGDFQRGVSVTCVKQKAVTR
jgi:hypothetical protein